MLERTNWLVEEEMRQQRAAEVTIPGNSVQNPRWPEKESTPGPAQTAASPRYQARADFSKSQQKKVELDVRKREICGTAVPLFYPSSCGTQPLSTKRQFRPFFQIPHMRRSEAPALPGSPAGLHRFLRSSWLPREAAFERYSQRSLLLSRASLRDPQP